MWLWDGDKGTEAEEYPELKGKGSHSSWEVTLSSKGSMSSVKKEAWLSKQDFSFSFRGPGDGIQLFAHAKHMLYR